MSTVYQQPWQTVDPNEWDGWLARSPHASIFMQSRYLQVVMPQGMIAWMGNKRLKNAQVAMVLPYQRRFWGTLPGAWAPPWWRYGGILWNGDYPPLRQQIRILEQMAKVARQYAVFHNWTAHPHSNMWLPFLDQGFSIQPRYTFCLSIRPWNEMLETFQPRMRTTMRKKLPPGHSIQWIAPDQAFQFIQAFGPERVGLRPKALHILQRLVQSLGSNTPLHSGAKCIGYFDHQTLRGILIVLLDQQTAYQMLPVIQRAPNVAIHAWMLRWLWQSLYRQGYREFDFMGSHLRGVLSFILKFAPNYRKYWHIRKNIWFK